MNDSIATIVAAVAVLVTLWVHSAALFSWGGSVREILKQHERRITKLEEEK